MKNCLKGYLNNETEIQKQGPSSVEKIFDDRNSRLDGKLSEEYRNL